MKAHHLPLVEETPLAELIRATLIDIRPDKLSGDWPDEARFVDDLGLDSLDLVELVARLEQSTGLFVPDEDFEGLISLASTADYIRARQAEHG